MVVLLFSKLKKTAAGSNQNIKNTFMMYEQAYVLIVPQMFERFKPEEKPPAELGASRDYNIDLVPKFIMVRMPWCELNVNCLLFECAFVKYILCSSRGN